jgi:hypothetical protein
VNEEPALELFLNLTLTQHPRDEPESWKVRVRLEVDSLRAWYYRIPPILTPWWICCKLTSLLAMNLKSCMKVVTRLKTPSSSHGLQFLVLDIIVGCTVWFADYS